MCDIKAKIVLTDIEGTTTSISYVKEVLFPYAKENAREYLKETWLSPETEELVRELLDLPQFRQEFKEDALDVDAVDAFVQYLIDKDLKVGPLKKLQGLVWDKGFSSGVLRGHVYPDVPDAFDLWQNAGLRLAIYSSGSVKAQQLLFGRSLGGNLLPYISAHFDTNVGHKQDKQSYINIAKSLETEPSDIVFLTDVVKEAEAAQAAGYQTVIVARPGNAPLTDDDKIAFKIVPDFESLTITKK